MAQCSNMKICVIFVLLVMGALADGTSEDVLYKDAMKVVNECGPKSLSLCLKEKALKFLERLPNNIDIGNGIKIRQSDSVRISRDYNPVVLPNQPEEREAVLDRLLIDRIIDYLYSHTLELKIPMLLQEQDNFVEEGRDKGGYGGGFGGGGGGGGKKKGKGKKGGMGTLMMMMMMKSGALFAVGLKVIAALAFKALLVAKVALTIATIIGLKKIVESGKGQSATYEVIAHAAHDEGHNDRVYNPGDLVYRGHRIGP